MSRLEGKVAVVLGAGGVGNMGQAIVHRFAAEGATVVVGGRNRAILDALAKEIGGKAITCDIVRRTDLEALAVGTIAAFGRIDVAVDCAGINFARPR